MARRVGKDRSTVANTLRLLRLPREVRDLLAAGRLDAGHARALLALERADDQVVLAREAARRGLSVREVERRVAAAARAAEAARRADANTRAAEERLRAALGTRVHIRRRGKGGALAIASRTRRSCSGSSRCCCARAGRGARAERPGACYVRGGRAGRFAGARADARARGRTHDQDQGTATSEDLNGFLDEGTELQGELRFRDTFRVDGKVKGRSSRTTR